MSEANPDQSGDADASPAVAAETSQPAKTPTLYDRMTKIVVPVLSVLLCLFTLFEVNYNQFQPQASLAIFVGFGMALCFLAYPIHPKLADNQVLRWIDVLLAIAASSCCAYVFVQSEETFKSLWPGGRSLADRPGLETTTDFAIGLTGLILVFEATRRAIGAIVPLLAFTFVAHSYYCYGSQNFNWPEMPSWLLPHGGQSIHDIVSTTYLQTLGVFGPAATVMFKYVFLFVVFGAFLEMSGATQFIIRFAERVFGRSPGGPAKVSVLGSGLMGSLSGSAVANAVTTGAFTIPMMRNAGFERHVAGGITAAAASGGALVPPVMGAGAYMMLELVQPQVTFLQVARAALVPAILYYLSIFLIVHFYSKKVGAQAVQRQEDEKSSLWEFEAVVFFGALGILVGLLIWGFSPFKAVTGSLIVILFLSIFRKKLALGLIPRGLALAIFFAGTLVHFLFFGETVKNPNIRQAVELGLDCTLVGTFDLLVFGLIHPAWRPAIMKALGSSAKNGVSLVAASACVGIIIGIVQQTGIATDFSASIKGVVETNLFLALVGITVCSIILGMGVPSVVCYLLMATLMGSLLSELGVIPLSAHLFIFYFGMMSMVTPPVALAAYASASIAEAPIMKTAFAAFRFSLVGFTLPFMFVYRPELTLQSDKPEVAIVAYRHTENADPGSLRISLKQFGDSFAEADVELRPVAGGETVKLNSGLYGSVSTKVAAGSQWDLFVQRNEQWDELGEIEIYDSPLNADSITEEDKQNRSYAWGQFHDARLSLVSIAMSTAAAVIGILALAAGLAGYLRRELSMLSRGLLFVSAALLLYPGAGVLVSGIRLPVSDLAGLAVFVCVVAATWKRSEETTPDAAAATEGQA
ncbi:MAG: TRAP transporter permease [Planctomycetota bacterium]